MKLTNDPGWKLQADGSRLRLEIYDVIGDMGPDIGVSAKDVSAAVQEQENVSTIDVHLNSPGGLAFDGITIYNVLVQADARVNVHIDGLAASAASIVAMAGDEINIAENAMMMIHQAQGITMGGSGEHKKSVNALETMDNQLIRTYASRSGASEDEIRKKMEAETWFSAEEAVEFGLADSMTEAKAIAASFDPEFLSNFANVPDSIRQQISNEKGITMATKKSKSREDIRNQSDEEEKRNQEEEEEEETRNQQDDDEEMDNEAESATNQEDDEETENEGDRTRKKKAQKNKKTNRAKSQSATLEQLRSEFPNASNDFIVECMEEGRTLIAAHRAYNEQMQDELEQIQAASKKPGTKPLSGGNTKQAENSADPAEQVNQLVQEEMGKGMSRQEAHAKVMRNNPSLRQQYVEHYNQKIAS